VCSLRAMHYRFARLIGNVLSRDLLIPTQKYGQYIAIMVNKSIFKASTIFQARCSLRLIDEIPGPD